MRSSVVIVSHRTPHLTEAAVLSAAGSEVDQIVVVDNASGDATIPVLRASTDTRVLVRENPSNDGFGAAANRGANEAGGEVIVFLNSDAAMSPGALGTLLAELEQWEGRAILGPRLIGPNGCVQPSAGLMPEPFDLAVRALGLHAVARWLATVPLIGPVVSRSRTSREYASAQNATEPFDTSMVSGACFAIGRDAFWELGGFDERFFMYFEDADLCRRASAVGMPVRYVPAAEVTHIGGASSSEEYHFGPPHARSMRQYLGKWYGPGGSILALGLLWLRAIGLTIAVRPGGTRAWRALWAAIRDEDPRR